MLGHRDELLGVSLGTSDNNGTGSDHPICDRVGRVLAKESVAGAARSGRDLPKEFTFTVFCEWIRYTLREGLERRWEIEINGVCVPALYAPDAG